MTYVINSPEGETYEEFLRRVWFNSYLTSGEWRNGQTLFNCAPAYIQDAVRGTLLDPFHLEARVPNFLEYAERVWRDTLIHLSYIDEDTALCGRLLTNNNRTSEIEETDCPQCLFQYNTAFCEEMEKNQ